MCADEYAGRGKHAARIVVNAINDNAELRGPDRYLISLLQELSVHQPLAEYLLACAPWQSSLLETPFGANVKKIILEPPRNRLARAIWQAAVFPRWVDRQDAALIFQPNVIMTVGMRTPCVMTVHDLAHFRFPEKFGAVKGRLQRILIRLALRAADRKIAVSNFTLADMANFCPGSERKTRVVAEGGPEPVERVAADPSPPYFLYVGRIEKSKNVELLIEEFAASRSLRERGFILRIVGSSGNAEADVRERISRLGNGRIERLGFVSEEKLEQLYLGTRAFIFPSLVEGFGLVLLEAMARGAPIVAMNTSVIPEVVGDAGILVSPDDRGGIGRAMELLSADDGLCAKLTGKGYDRLNSFSWKRAARETFSVFSEVLR
jgi:glycosyltransferase involved in cell wall biosynthesis